MSSSVTSSTQTNPKQIVLDFIDAMNHFDYKKARTYVADDLSFVGVLGTRNGAEAYFADMEKMKLQYNIIRTFADGDDVCLIYDIKMSGMTVFCCGWYQLQSGKIRSFRVVFDPRPVLEQAKKN
jgi:limonene-1,2-epoxide hydrolase